MTVRQNASTVYRGFLIVFDPWEIFVMFQAWWQIIYKIVGLIGNRFMVSWIFLLQELFDLRIRALMDLDHFDRAHMSSRFIS